MGLLILLLTSLILSISIMSAHADEKLRFQYTVFPNTVYVDDVVNLTVCMTNIGGSGMLINDGTVNDDGTLNKDNLVISIPLGNEDGDLIDDPVGISCNPQDPSSLWTCDAPSIIGDEIFFTFYHNGTYYFQEGDTICFIIDTVNINSKVGNPFLNVIENYAPQRADKTLNNTMNIFKNERGTSAIVETDPTVPDSVKDGTDWSEISSIPSGFADGVDNGITTETDPTVPESVKDGTDWSEITSIPECFADGEDNGITTETDPTVQDRLKKAIEDHNADYRNAHGYFAHRHELRGYCHAVNFKTFDRKVKLSKDCPYDQCQPMTISAIDAYTSDPRIKIGRPCSGVTPPTGLIRITAIGNVTLTGHDTKVILTISCLQWGFPEHTEIGYSGGSLTHDLTIPYHIQHVVEASHWPYPTLPPEYLPKFTLEARLSDDAHDHTAFVSPTSMTYEYLPRGQRR